MSKERGIPIRNLYYMLSYAFQSLNWEGCKGAEAEEFENAYDFFAWWLAQEIGKQRRRGLYREYVTHEEDLASPRGKINIAGTILNRFARKRDLRCEYDELSENNFLNQILKATALRLMGCAGVARENRLALGREMSFFSNVDATDLKRARWAGLHYQKGNKRYRDLIAICQFILEGSPANGKGGTKMDCFNPDNMPKLYEKFILCYYKKEHSELDYVDNPKIGWAGVSSGEIGMLPEMRSDVVLRKGGDVLVIDAKFYTKNIQDSYGSEKIISDNLYQIFTYVKNMDAAQEFGAARHRVSGMLLYAAADKEALPSQPKGSWQICGNQISAATLDLNCCFNDIKSQLDKIAADHFK